MNFGIQLHNGTPKEALWSTPEPEVEMNFHGPPFKILFQEYVDRRSRYMHQIWYVGF